MSTLTRLCVRPIRKVEVCLTFDVEVEKKVILEEGLLYSVKYIEPTNGGDSTTELKEIVGRLSKIKATRGFSGFNPFYNGDIYILEFDCSENFISAKLEITTTQLRDIDLFTVSTEGEDNNGEPSIGDTEEDTEAPGDTGNTGDNTEIGSGESEGSEGDVTDGNNNNSTETGDGNPEPDTGDDLNQPTEDPESEEDPETPVE